MITLICHITLTLSGFYEPDAFLSFFHVLTHLIITTQMATFVTVLLLQMFKLGIDSIDNFLKVRLVENICSVKESIDGCGNTRIILVSLCK